MVHTPPTTPSTPSPRNPVFKSYSDLALCILTPPLPTHSLLVDLYKGRGGGGGRKALKFLLKLILPVVFIILKTKFSLNKLNFSQVEIINTKEEIICQLIQKLQKIIFPRPSRGSGKFLENIYPCLCINILAAQSLITGDWEGGN